MNFGLMSSPCLQPLSWPWSHLLPELPEWILALVLTLTALGVVNGPCCPSALTAELRPCRTLTFGEGTAGTGVPLAIHKQPELVEPWQNFVDLNVLTLSCTPSLKSLRSDSFRNHDKLLCFFSFCQLGFYNVLKHSKIRIVSSFPFMFFIILFVATGWSLSTMSAVTNSFKSAM